MMPRVKVPVRMVNGEKWGQLSVLGHTHFVVAEEVRQLADLTFADGHRVRHYRLKKNVHWRIPVEAEIDITDVPQKAPPRRR